MQTKDKVLLEKIKTKKIRYFNTGWTRAFPFTKVFETPATLTKIQRDNEAHFLIQFGDKLDYQVLLVCKCLDYKKTPLFTDLKLKSS